MIEAASTGTARPPITAQFEAVLLAQDRDVATLATADIDDATAR